MSSTVVWTSTGQGYAGRRRWSPDAQRSIRKGVILIALAVLVLAFFLVLRQRYATAFAAVAVGLGCFSAWAIFVAPLGERFGI